MPVWTLANMKGGVAKTTSVLMLGRAAVQDGKRVLLVDLDLNGQLSRQLGYWPQGQAGVFGSQITPYQLHDRLSLLPAPGADFPLDSPLLSESVLADRLKPFVREYDLCIVDTPSGYMPFLRALLCLSDVWITPTTLTPAVRQASAHYLLRMARLALASQTRLKVRLLPVQFNHHLGSHKVGLASLRRFVGDWRVLPPVRQDRRLHQQDVLNDSTHLSIEDDYIDVYASLGIS